MPATKERIELRGPLDLTLPDGSTVTVRPGPYGRGISVVARPARRAAAPGAGGGGGGPRGRPPRPSTIELRALLQKDAAAKALKPAAHYIDWLVAKEPKASRATLQQTAYRELRAAGGGARRGRGKGRRRGARRAAGEGRRGRAPHPATLLLRERLQKDGAAGALQAPSAYIRFLVDKANLGIKRARPIVYRELRLAKKSK